VNTHCRCCVVHDLIARRSPILEREIVMLEVELDIDDGFIEYAQRLGEQLFSGLVAIEDDDGGALQVIS
jgi:cob(I)alamin adenosyltransferase